MPRLVLNCQKMQGKMRYFAKPSDLTIPLDKKQARQGKHKLGVGGRRKGGVSFAPTCVKSPKKY